MRKIGIDQYRVLQVGAGEDGAAKIDPNQLGTNHFCIAEVGKTEIGPGKIRIREIRAARHRIDNIGSHQAHRLILHVRILKLPAI